MDVLYGHSRPPLMEAVAVNNAGSAQCHGYACPEVSKSCDGNQLLTNQSFELIRQSIACFQILAVDGTQSKT